MEENKKAVILSGGLGARLKPFTNAIPKPLLPIGEKAVLEIQIERLAQHGFTEIYLATNYKADYIENFFGDGSRYGINLHISKEDSPLGTAGPLKLLENELDSPFLVMNGDILSLVDYSKLYAFATNLDAQLTVGIKKMILPFAFGNIFFEGDYVSKIEEKPDIVTHALAGIYLMKPSILKAIPLNTYYGIDDLMNRMLSEGNPIAKYEIEEYWLDIGSPDDYKRAQEDYETFYDEH